MARAVVIAVIVEVDAVAAAAVANRDTEQYHRVSREKEEILSQTYELDELRAKRLEWGLFRDRRPEYYGIIAGEKNGR